MTNETLCNRCKLHAATNRFTSPVIDGYGSDYLICDWCVQAAFEIMDAMDSGFQIYSLVSPEDQPKGGVLCEKLD